MDYELYDGPMLLNKTKPNDMRKSGKNILKETYFICSKSLPVFHTKSESTKFPYYESAN